MLSDIALLQLEDAVYADSSVLATRQKSFGSITTADAAEIARAASFYAKELDTIAPWEDRFLELKIAHPTIPDFGGTIDCLVVRDNYLEIYDLKTGKWPAHPEQLLCYAALANTQFPRMIVHTTIVQPRANDGQRRRVFSWTADDLDAFEELVQKAATSDDLQAGPHCRFCALRDTCPAFDPDMLVNFCV